MLGFSGKKALPGSIRWPNGFSEIFDFAYVGSPAARPREFDPIARIGGDQPHHGYPLRSVAEEGFVVTTGGGTTGPQRRVATLNLQQAIREAYPGAIYLHLGEGWRVHEWRTTTFDRAIRVSQTKSRAFTKPLLRTFLNVSVDRDGLVDGRFRVGDHGFLAECQLQITERVEGYLQAAERKIYKEVRQSDPNMTPKTRDFRTTGVVLRITAPWFTRTGKLVVAEALHGLLIREFSISPADVDFAATNISLIKNGQREAALDVIVIYDATYGSLRLSEPLYVKFASLIERLSRAVDITPEEALLPGEAVEGLGVWFSALGPDTADAYLALMQPGEEPNGWLQVYTPGSVVAKRDVQGVLRDIELIGPELLSIGGPPKLFYRYKVSALGTALVQADAVEAVGEDWSMCYWNPQTNEFRDVVDDLVPHLDRPVSLADSAAAEEA
jgi:DEAD/DEAH box helicase domain-containing protein